MSKMIDTLKAAIEAEKEKPLAELPQAVEPRLSAIRREIEARELLLARLTGREPPDRSRRNHRPGGPVASAALGDLKAEL